MLNSFVDSIFSVFLLFFSIFVFVFFWGGGLGCDLYLYQVTRKSFKVKRGPSYAPRRVRRQAELTKEMLANGSWKDSAFKEYNFKALGVPCGGGNLHPLLKV